MVYHNGSNHNYHFIAKGLAKEYEGEFNCLKEDTEKCKPFSVSITKKFKGLIKMEKKLQKPYLTKYNYWLQKLYLSFFP